MNESTVNSQVKWIYNCRCFEMLCLGLSSAVHLKPWTAGGSMSTPSGKPFEAGTRQGPGVIWAVSKHHWFVVHIGLLLTYCKEIITIHDWNSYKQKPVEPVRNQVIDAAQSEFKKPNGLSSFSSIYRIYIPNSKFSVCPRLKGTRTSNDFKHHFSKFNSAIHWCISQFSTQICSKKIDRKLKEPWLTKLSKYMGVRRFASYTIGDDPAMPAV